MLSRIALLLTLAAAAILQAEAQIVPTVGQDSKAISALQQALVVSGAATNPVRAFTATGTITYFWAGHPVQGAATIRARGSDQFRLDASLPDGARSYVSNREGGSRKAQDGKLSDIPVHNTLSTTILTMPYPAIAAALSDPTCSITYIGQVDLGGKPAYQIRVARMLGKESDPDGTLSRLSQIDYYIDMQTFLVSRTEDLTHPLQSMTESYSHSIEFDGYTAMSGVAVPTLVREKVAGQTTWELRIAAITLNSNLQDTDFILQ